MRQTYNRFDFFKRIELGFKHLIKLGGNQKPTIENKNILRSRYDALYLFNNRFDKAFFQILALI